MIDPKYLPKVRGIYKHMFMLKNITRFNVGGIAEVFFIPKDENDLIDFLSKTHNILPTVIIGAGSNLLIRDGGIKGVVIKLRDTDEISVDNNYVISVNAATLNSKLLNFCYNNDIGGIEFIAGIPGSIGGGVFMNSGSFGKEFKDVTKAIDIISNSGEKLYLNNNEIKFDYRSTNIPENFIITKIYIQGYYENKQEIKNKINYILKKKRKSQPIYSKTGGSTFKNSPTHKAWQLIDKIGFRGAKLGGAQFSELHCNFLINNNNATSNDLEQLGLLAQKNILKQTGILLKWEIKIIGEYNYV